MQQIVHGPGVRGLAAGAAALMALAAAATPAAAGESAGCKAANRGSLNVSVGAGGSAQRTVTLDEGETLALTVATRGAAAVEILGDDGDPHTLHAGRGSALVFVAPDAGAYGVRLAADDGADARLAVTCISAARAASEQALLDRRKAFLAARDPDRIRIDRTPTAPKALDSFTPAEADGGPPRDVAASISLSELAAAMKLAGKHEPGILDFWFEGRYTSYGTVGSGSGPGDGSFSVMYLGSQYMLGPDIMLGYLAQFDQAGEVSDDGGVSASGWMAGPYMSVRFGHGIVFDGRAAWGVAGSLPAGVALDTASADRSLVRGTLRGTRQVGGWTVAPSVGLSYAEDTPSMPGTALSDATPTGSGRLDVLPELRRRFDLGSETYVEPRLAAGGFLAFDDLSRLAPSGALGAPDLHWKAEAGVAVGKKDSLNLEATGGVETGGATAADNWSGKLKLNVPLGN